MTREEQIKGLYALKEYLVRNPIDLEGHKSLPITLIDYAIETLEQEPVIRHNEVKGELNRVKDELEPTTKNDLALIHTEGLDEEIRCTMCTNYMKSDRGCDGSCVVNKDMYKAVMDAIEKRIQPTTKNDLGVDCNNCKNNFHRGDGTSYCTTGDGMCHYECEEPTTKNDLGVDCISRDEVCRYVAEFVNHEFSTKEEEELINNIITGIEHMTSATPQGPKSEWQKDHAILKAYSDGANEVLDKIRAEIDTYLEIEGFGSEYRNDVKKIIDKYTAESAHDVAQEIVKNNGIVDL